MYKVIIILIMFALFLPSVLLADKDCMGICGDANGDGDVNISDAVWIINFVFQDGPPPVPILACGDFNTDCAVNISDGVRIINFIFQYSPPWECATGCWEDNGGDCCPNEWND